MSATSLNDSPTHFDASNTARFLISFVAAFLVAYAANCSAVQPFTAAAPSSFSASSLPTPSAARFVPVSIAAFEISLAVRPVAPAAKSTAMRRSARVMPSAAVRSASDSMTVFVANLVAAFLALPLNSLERRAPPPNMNPPTAPIAPPTAAPKGPPIAVPAKAPTFAAAAVIAAAPAISTTNGTDALIVEPIWYDVLRCDSSSCWSMKRRTAIASWLDTASPSCIFFIVLEMEIVSETVEPRSIIHPSHGTFPRFQSDMPFQKPAS